MVTVTVSTAAKTAIFAPPLRVLLVGDQEEDFFLIREILERNRATLEADLEHAPTIDDAKSMMGKKSYDLILFEHASGDAEAVGLISELLRGGVSVPFILLTADADEKTVAELIRAGNWNCLAKSRLDAPTLLSAIRSTLAIHSLQLEHQTAEELLRKLSRAVEQSADTVVVTNRHGVIEYVNPAFETLSGYSSDEVCGKTHRVLKSGEQTSEMYREMWNTILEGNVFR